MLLHFIYKLQAHERPAKVMIMSGKFGNCKIPELPICDVSVAFQGSKNGGKLGNSVKNWLKRKFCFSLGYFGHNSGHLFLVVAHFSTCIY